MADPTQDVYGQRAWTDELRLTGAGFSGPWTELRGSYRMPPDLTPVVAEFAQLALDDWDVNPSVPDDHPLNMLPFQPTVRRWVNIEPGESSGHRLGREVLTLLMTNPDLSPSDVVFLANSHEEGLDAVRVIEIAGFQVQHMFGRTPTEKRDPQAGLLERCERGEGFHLPELQGLGIASRRHVGRLERAAPPQRLCRPDEGQGRLHHRPRLRHRGQQRRRSALLPGTLRTRQLSLGEGG